MDRRIFEEEHEMFRDAARSFLINEVQPLVDRWNQQEIVDRPIVFQRQFQIHRNATDIILFPEKA